MKEIWNYTIKEIIDGYSEDNERYQCVVCGKAFDKGSVSSIDGTLFDAWGAVRQHIGRNHGHMADCLIQRQPDLMGISDIQRQVLGHISQGDSDKEISAALGIAPSTVRNHRFKLREKEKQAKLYLAMMAALEMKIERRIEATEKGNIEELHLSASMIDDRYGITEQESIKTLNTYMDENGALKQFPAREKKKIIVLREIAKNFQPDTEYTEKEVNRVLKRIYEADYPSVRRALIEYGFMDRSVDCGIYRLKP